MRCELAVKLGQFRNIGGGTVIEHVVCQGCGLGEGAARFASALCIPAHLKVVNGTAGSGALHDALRLHHHREAWQN